MPSAERQKRRLDTMPIRPWSSHFFRGKKGDIAEFLQRANVGITSTKTSLHRLEWKDTPWRPTARRERDGQEEEEEFGWTCPPDSPRTSGAASPDELYPGKIKPPEEQGSASKKGQWRRRKYGRGSGPNHRRSERRAQKRDKEQDGGRGLFAKRYRKSNAGWLTTASRPKLRFTTEDLEEKT